MPTIAVAGSDMRWDCEPGDTIMRSAVRAGLGFPYECNVGACGNCRYDLLEGEIEELRKDAPGLSARDRERGRRLGCQSRPLRDCSIKVRFMPAYVSAHKPVHQSATLIGQTDITHDIREFRFKLDANVQFLAGQYALLELPGVDGARAYSMANIGNEAGEWHFQIRRVPNGAATGVLFDTLAIGDATTIDGPYGMAYFREDAGRDIVCIAGGSGLSPMISIARAASVSENFGERRIDFVYGGRTIADICGEDMLAQLPRFNSHIHYHPVVSAGEGEDWNGHRGFVHDIAQQLFSERLKDCEIYFAGPPLMGQAMQKMLFDLGVPPSQIHFDQFY